MCVNMLLGKPLPIYGDGQNIRDWVFVEDHCRAISAVLTRPSPVPLTMWAVRQR